MLPTSPGPSAMLSWWAGWYPGVWWAALTRGPGAGSRLWQWTWGSGCPLWPLESLSSSPSPQASGNRPGTEGLSHIQALYTQLLNLLTSTTRHCLPHCPHDGVTAQRGAMAGASFTPCSSGRAQQVLGQASSPDRCPSGCLDQTRLPTSRPVLLPTDIALVGPQYPSPGGREVPEMCSGYRDGAQTRAQGDGSLQGLWAPWLG